MPTLHEIAAYLDQVLHVERHGGERSGALTAADPHVRRIGLALDPADLVPCIAAEPFDAVLLHRSWGYERLALPPSLGVLAYHLPFDDHMTLGENPRLAAVLAMTSVEPLVRQGSRVLGMVGDVLPRDATELYHSLARIFGGLQETVPPREDVVRRIAVVGAMTAATIDEAGRSGADVYLTGQLRAPARQAVAETGIGVVAVGHARAERWGLRCLEGVLRERWPELEVVVCDPVSHA
jgi:putative NIF3 family GTP cyclohydrolase 1 type 2